MVAQLLGQLYVSCLMSRNDSVYVVGGQVAFLVYNFGLT